MADEGARLEFKYRRVDAAAVEAEDSGKGFGIGFCGGY
jgi:hypothetical protein